MLLGVLDGIVPGGAVRRTGGVGPPVRLYRGSRRGTPTEPDMPPGGSAARAGSLQNQAKADQGDLVSVQPQYNGPGDPGCL